LLFALVGDENVEVVLTDPDKYALYAGMRESLALLSRRRDGALNDGRQFLTYDGSPFHEISVPTLILHGTHDAAVNPEGARRLHRLIEDSTYIEIEGGTHFMLISHIDTIAPAIMDFLDTHAPD
jgi:pimeloyl-ACP methyl ester carboxylesterase